VKRSDVLLVPRCEVASDVVFCWHDVIKNRIQSFSDSLLEEWLRDAEHSESFEAALRRIAGNIAGYSPGEAAVQLRPILDMPPRRRQELADALTALFQAGFKPDERRERLNSLIESMQAALRACRINGHSDERARNLAGLRTAAAALRQELELLPLGFWMPTARSEHRS